jgi:enamine deaminase RidA (YjgF/YER057c/UK114 family)
MTITRIDAEARWSDVVIHNQTLYYTGVPANLDADAFEQTANTLAQIDAVLEKQGSDKSRILDATIFLADKSDFAAMNKAWDAWVVAGHAPVRCTVEATLMNPQYKLRSKLSPRCNYSSSSSSSKRATIRSPVCVARSSSATRAIAWPLLIPWAISSWIRSTAFCCCSWLSEGKPANILYSCYIVGRNYFTPSPPTPEGR